MRQTDKTSNLKIKFFLFLLLFSGAFYAVFYYGFDFWEAIRLMMVFTKRSICRMPVARPI